MSSLRKPKASSLRKILFATLIASSMGIFFFPLLLPPEAMVVPTQNSFSLQVPLSKVQFSDHSFKGRSNFETRTGFLTEEDLEEAKSRLLKKMIADILASRKKDSAVTGILDESLVAHFQDSEPATGTATRSFELGLQGELTLGNINRKDLPIKDIAQVNFRVSGDFVTIVMTSASE